jgi:glutamate-5-semialdehyde dehydrogenase
MQRLHLSLTPFVRTVPSLAAVVVHITEHGSHHADCVVTESTLVGSTLVRDVYTAGVFVVQSLASRTGSTKVSAPRLGIAWADPCVGVGSKRPAASSMI